MIIRVSGAALMLLFTVLVARFLTLSDAGVFFLFSAIVVVASVLGRLGTDSILVNEVAVRNSKDDWSGYDCLEKYLGLTFLGGCVISFIVLIGWTVASEYGLVHEVGGVLGTMVLAIPPLAVIVTLSEFHKGMGRPIVSSAVRFIVMPATAIVLLLCWDLVGALSVARVYVFSVAFSCLVGILLSLEFNGLVCRKISGLSDVLKRSAPLLLVAVCGLVVGWLDSVLVGLMLGPKVVAQYSVASKISTFVGFIGVAVLAVMSAPISVYVREGRLEQLKKVFKVSCFLSVLSGAVLISILFIFGQDLLLVMGSEYVAAYKVMMLLSMAQWVNVGFGPVGFIMVAFGKGKEFSLIYCLVSSISLLLYILFVPLYGMDAAAIISVVIFLVVNTLCLHSLKRAEAL